MSRLRAELQHLRRDPGWGSHKVGAGHHEPGVRGLCQEKLSEEVGYSRTGTPRTARSCNSPNWEACAQVVSSESPPPAHSRARGGGGVRGTPSSGEPGTEGVLGNSRGTLASFPRGICLPPPFVTGCAGSPLLQEQTGVLVGGWGPVLLNPFAALPSSLFPLASAPISNPGPLNLITFPDIGRFFFWGVAEGPEKRWGGVSVCVCLWWGGGGCGRAWAWADPSANFGEGTSPGK